MSTWEETTGQERILMESNRCRFTFAKNAEMRFTGHLDLFHAWQRVFRRAKLSIQHTQGFHPQPKMQLAAALPLGFLSTGELLDVWFKEGMDPDQVFAQISQYLPPGITCLSVTRVDGPHPSLPSLVTAADYSILLPNSPAADIHPLLDQLMALDEIPWERKNKPFNMRPLLLSAHCTAQDHTSVIWLRVSAREGATGRPDEFLQALKIDPCDALITRTQLILGASPSLPD